MKEWKGYLVGILIFAVIFWFASALGDSRDSTYNPDCIDYGKGGWYC